MIAWSREMLDCAARIRARPKSAILSVNTSEGRNPWTALEAGPSARLGVTVGQELDSGAGTRSVRV